MNGWKRPAACVGEKKRVDEAQLLCADVTLPWMPGQQVFRTPAEPGGTRRRTRVPGHARWLERQEQTRQHGCAGHPPSSVSTSMSLPIQLL